MNNKFLVMVVLLCSGITHAMENVENDTLTAIQKWQDVSPFAGKVVAYTARTEWLNNNVHRCMLPSSNLSYAYINDSSLKHLNSGRQYTLRQLLKKPSIQSNMKELIDDVLAQESLVMREVTAQEAQEIVEALTVKNASFACVHFYDEQDLISRLRSIAKNKA